MADNRKLIKRNETKISYLQIIGFVLIILPILYFIGKFIYNLALNVKSIPAIDFTAQEVSIMFFITMLGFALAFPDLLQDQNKGLSTMRLVVFMMTNVICLLFLKIGWDCSDLTSMGVNQYWVGIIAFVFGAKAVQSFFENFPFKSNFSNGITSSVQPQNNTVTSVSYSNDDLIKMAINQTSVKHLAGVVGVGRAYITTNGVRQACLQINVNDKNLVDNYSKPLSVDLGNGNQQTIIPKVVFVGIPKTHSGIAGKGIVNVNGANGDGTAGCVVIDNHTKKKHLLSCQHVLSHDASCDTVGGSAASIALATDATTVIAKHVKGERTHEIDAGLAEVLADYTFDNSTIGNIKGIKNLTVSDTNETVIVNLIGFDFIHSQSHPSTGVIVNNEFYAEFEYADGNNFGIEDLIVLSQKQGDTYNTLSQSGYSGALVLTADNYAIGLLVGGDDNYSYAIPIHKILTALNCSIL